MCVSIGSRHREEIQGQGINFKIIYMHTKKTGTIHMLINSKKIHINISIIYKRNSFNETTQYVQCIMELKVYGLACV